MNHINTAVESTIMTLHQQGWSQRRIAREMGVNRETVARYVGLAAAKPAIPPPRLGGDLGGKPSHSARRFG